jgi:hypothetical protein
MKRLLLCGGSLGVVIMCLMFALCRKDPITSWDSPRMLAMKQEWNSLLEEFEKDPRSPKWGLKNDNLIDMQQGILKNNLSRADMRRLAATCATLPVHEEELSDFEIHVLEFMMAMFIENGDRESLVTLLSTRLHEYVGPETTTTWYLLHYSKSGLKDPVLVLGEAYARCKEPEVQRQIAQVVRRGFEGYGITGKDDAEFVKNAMQWYEREKNHLIVREDYSTPYPESFFEFKKETKQPTR